MELKTELTKGNSDKIRMLKDVSLKVILFHFVLKRTGERTDKAHIAELQKSIKQVSKQPNSYRSRCLLMLCMYNTS